MTEAEAKQSWIPAIADDVLEEMAQRMMPVVHKDGAFWQVALPVPKAGQTLAHTLRITAHLWKPQLLPLVPGLRELARVRTYHTFSFYGFFKPTIAEVLAQVPPHLLTDVQAFKVVDGPQTADDLNRERAATEAGYHVATTVFYAMV
jgi:hypothetical protein